MNLLLFIVAIIISFIVIRIGAIAFQLTGLEWSLAKFQALSCFTGTGFTTKEAELITGNTQRRKIASFLIVLGHAGFVTLIATFANSLRPNQIMSTFTLPILHSVIPSGMIPWINLIVIIMAIYVSYRVFTYAKFAGKLTDFLRSHIVKKEIVKRVSFEELVIATGGYGVSQIEICDNSQVLNKTLLESGLKELDILVLAIERKETTIPNPSAGTRILLGDSLICFGKLGSIRKKLCMV
ncbi:MAG: hypothetical protein KJ706_06885 [Candidatus Omnitrophica bacterium]|nr:hypothetical protein [Candidatus Omnitrophota bacterium]MBU4457256.1 hypothetical protein [Candidatus Omnitrophota bacterium]